MSLFVNAKLVDAANLLWFRTKLPPLSGASHTLSYSQSFLHCLLGCILARLEHSQYNPRHIGLRSTWFEPLEFVSRCMVPQLSAGIKYDSVYHYESFKTRSWLNRKCTRDLFWWWRLAEAIGPSGYKTCFMVAGNCCFEQGTQFVYAFRQSTKTT
ncbi:unnamed protein product [Ixodes persulcatus]